MQTEIKTLIPAGQGPVTIKALVVILLCCQIIIGCGSQSCPSREVAERIAKQFVYKDYAADQYNVDLEVTKKFLKKIKNEEYCVYEFNYKVTLKEYFLRYETLVREKSKKGMQIAYIYNNGWYGTVIQKPQ